MVNWCRDCYWFNCLVGFVVQPSLASWAGGGPTIALLTFPWKDTMLWQRQLHTSKKIQFGCTCFSLFRSYKWWITTHKRGVLKLHRVKCPSEILKNKSHCRMAIFKIHTTYTILKKKLAKQEAITEKLINLSTSTRVIITFNLNKHSWSCNCEILNAILNMMQKTKCYFKAAK